MGAVEIKANGVYTAQASAEGYRSNSKEIVINCDPNVCGDCSGELIVPLVQEFCENTFLKVTVTDLETSAPVKDATVQIRMKTGNSSQAVSNHLVCPEERSVREECGYYGIQEQECIDRSCCWDSSVDGELFCYKTVELDAMKTDDSGTVSVPVLGQGEFTVDIIKDGYVEYTGQTPVYCPAGDDCELCNPTLAVSLNPDFCEKTVQMNIQVIDDNEEPVENAAIQLILSSSLADAGATNVGGELLTDGNGTVSPQLYESGSYMVTVTAAGFLPTSVVQEVEAACENPLLPITIKLGKDTDNSPEESSCSNTTMMLLVVDLLTGVPVKDAIVNINLEDNLVASNVKTDVNGHVEVPASVNGNYQVTVAKTGYMAADGNMTIECSTLTNCTCDTTLTLSLDQPRCDPDTAQSVLLPVVVKDNITNQLVEGALVTLILTNSLSGSSMMPVDQPRYTDANRSELQPRPLPAVHPVSICHSQPRVLSRQGH